MSACLFCRMVAGEVPTRMAYEDAGVFAFHDIAPEAPVHVLVIPREHVAVLADLTPEQESSFLGGVNRAARALGLDSTTGYRMVVNSGSDAGQSVHHLHAHLLAGRELSWPPG